MIWDDARWDGKVKEKWGKAYPDGAVARRVEDHLDRVQEHLDQLREGEDAHREAERRGKLRR